MPSHSTKPQLSQVIAAKFHLPSGLTDRLARLERTAGGGWTYVGADGLPVPGELATWRAATGDEADSFAEMRADIFVVARAKAMAPRLAAAVRMTLVGVALPAAVSAPGPTTRGTPNGRYRLVGDTIEFGGS